MPAISDAQRGFMYARHRKIAKKWEAEGGMSGPLPKKLHPGKTVKRLKVRMVRK